MTHILLIGVGGFGGAITRYLVASAVTRWLDRTGGAFPWGTLVVNVSGSLLLALFLAWASKRLPVTSDVRLLVATGFFGAYTTFSTFATDSINLLRAGDWVGGLGNLLATNMLCALGVVIGLLIGERL